MADPTARVARANVYGPRVVWCRCGHHMEQHRGWHQRGACLASVRCYCVGFDPEPREDVNSQGEEPRVDG